MSELFEIQPEQCRQPLPEKKFEWNEWQLAHKARAPNWEKVMMFDPTELYERVGHLIDPRKRMGTLHTSDTFPPREDNTCGCGCGEKLTGRATRWFTPQHGSMCFDITAIINNSYKRPHFYISKYFGEKCIECGTDDWRATLQLDHIVAVKHGGGGSWLSNYQWLCHDCHVDKTNKDFNRGQYKEVSQISLDFNT